MLNWAIVGCGRISDLRIAPGLKDSGINRLAAVVSRDARKAADFARKHGAEKSFDSYERMLEDPAIDVVYLGTPNALHARQTVAACAAGKQVFCEKPMACTVADCEAMVRAAREHGVKLGIAFNNRYNPAHLELKRRLDAGALGQIMYASVRAGSAGDRVSWRLDGVLSGGGVLMDVGVHAIDLLRFFLGREVVQASALIDTTPYEWPLDQVVSALLEFDGGIHGFIGVSEKFPYARNCVEIVGSRGSISAIGRPASRTRDPVPLPSFLEMVLEGDPVRTDFEVVDIFRAELDAFGDAVTRDVEPEISGVDGLRVQEVAEAIRESARSGRAIRLR